MDQCKRTVIGKRVQKVIENLRKNNMQSFYVEKKEDAWPAVEKLLKKGETVAVGGSMSLFECGVIDRLRNGEYQFLDRYENGLSREEINKIFIDSFSADTYISSSNAVTENGELYNVDGNSNRTAALLYGPQSVIIVAGYNKIVKNLDDAIHRVKTIAAPANCQRLNYQAYCRETGECMAFKTEKEGMTEGCKGQGRICCNYVVSAQQRVKDRIKVILVGEELGF
jgi:L-lactate utilization protein LutB